MQFYNTEKRYNQFSAYLKDKFGVKVYKITLDAGFSCPNRDGKISTGGCIFCDDGGSFSQAHSNLLSIEEQVQTGIKTLSGVLKPKNLCHIFKRFQILTNPSLNLKKSIMRRFAMTELSGFQSARVLIALMMKNLN